MSAHTPGPWTLNGEYMTRHVYARGEKISGVVAVINLAWPGKEQQDEQRANAHLIASAPELLAALEAALLVIEDYLEYDHNGDPWTEDARTMGEMDINDYERDGRLESARAVIALATGAA